MYLTSGESPFPPSLGGAPLMCKMMLYVLELSSSNSIPLLWAPDRHRRCFREDPVTADPGKGLPFLTRGSGSRRERVFSVDFVFCSGDKLCE